MSSLNESELFMKYKSSFTTASYDLIRHVVYITFTMYWIWVSRMSLSSIVPSLLLGLLQVKTFIIFHDCGHYSYVPHRIYNQLIGFITGVLIGTPFSWTIRHDTHHATNGNIENKYKWKYNEHIYYTLQEFQKMNVWKQRLIRIFLAPEFFYLFFPLLNFLVLERFSVYKLFTRQSRLEKNSLYIVIEQLLHNICFGLYAWMMYHHSMFYQWILSLWVASNIGVMLFHNQHTFHPAYIVKNNEWTVKDSGLKGSSYIIIPYYLRYFTGGIEYHHIHHMNSKIPSYHLKLYHEEASHLFSEVPTLSLKNCYTNLWLVLYDEENKKYTTCPF
jgi:acyl-lipid omega-6 desaturase (Delta-12 desaturase)